jgi:putative SOS response-associated peptidase YedK
MCGRFTLFIEAEKLQLSFGFEDVPQNWEPRYNVAPTQPIAAILDEKKRSIEFLYWGLVPSWAKDISIGAKMINARAETILEKPSFKNAFQRRRCLILADGFYEWKKSKSNKSSTPYYFQMKDESLFAFAGIYEIWHSPDGGELWSAAIITTAANELVSAVHERMPVILDGDTMWNWLQDRPLNQLSGMLKPYEPEKMKATQVSSKVNLARTEGPELIKPANSLFK